MTLLAEGLAAMRGCWRLITRDPDAFDDFNLTIEGFWRSFAMVLPLAVIAYPLFALSHRFAIEQGMQLPDLNLRLEYLTLFLSVAVWPIITAVLARLFGIGATYLRYMVVYNWISLPATFAALVPQLLYALIGPTVVTTFLPLVVYILLLFLTWYVAKEGFATTRLIAVGFLVVEFAMAHGLNMLTQ